MELVGGEATSSKIPNFKLIPRRALLALIKRFELGVERHGDKAWNALSKNQEALEDKEFLLERAQHAMDHASKLIAIATGQMEDDGDDHAAAIMWAGACLSSVDWRNTCCVPPTFTIPTKLR